MYFDCGYCVMNLNMCYVHGGGVTYGVSMLFLQWVMERGGSGR